MVSFGVLTRLWTRESVKQGCDVVLAFPYSQRATPETPSDARRALCFALAHRATVVPSILPFETRSTPPTKGKHSMTCRGKSVIVIYLCLFWQSLKPL